MEARRHEKPEWTNDPESYEELKAGETLIREDEVFVQFCMYSVVKAALETPGCVDLDAIAGLAACIQTHKTLDSGLVYESKAADPVAAQVQAKFEAALADYANELKETDPLRSLRNSKILTALIFLHHLGKNSLNGRPRGRHFIDMLRKMAPPVDDLAPDKGSLISLS